jgi:hypothetical protein
MGRGPDSLDLSGCCGLSDMHNQRWRSSQATHSVTKCIPGRHAHEAALTRGEILDHEGCCLEPPASHNMHWMAIILEEIVWFLSLAYRTAD